MAVEARFYVAQVGKNAYGSAAKPVGTVTLQAVTRKEGDNRWASATPSGQMTMTINSDALAWFDERLGKDIRIVLSDVPTDD